MWILEVELRLLGLFSKYPYLLRLHSSSVPEILMQFSYKFIKSFLFKLDVCISQLYLFAIFLCIHRFVVNSWHIFERPSFIHKKGKVILLFCLLLTFLTYLILPRSLLFAVRGECKRARGGIGKLLEFLSVSLCCSLKNC